MKKILLSAVAGVLFVSAIQAQEGDRPLGTTTKSGRNILPAAGDFAIGVEATPFLQYFGNMFTDRVNDAPFFEGKDQTIYGKYFLTDNSAIRARVNFGFGSQKETTEVPTVADPGIMTTNSVTDRQNNFGLNVGYELRRGYGRLQGFYGGEVGFGVANESTEYKYGNAISSDNQVASRPVSEKDGRETMFSLGGFAGIEYFVAPKIAIGGELSAGLGFGSAKGGKSVSEGWDPATSTVESTTVDFSKNKDSNFNFGTNTGARLLVTFHF